MTFFHTATWSAAFAFLLSGCAYQKSVDIVTTTHGQSVQMVPVLYKPAEIARVATAAESTPFPLPLTPQQMKDIHGIDRIYDPQTGLLCYVMRRTGGIWCTPLAATSLPASRITK